MEIWKLINERYEVSSFGNIRSLDRKRIDKKGRDRFIKGKNLSLNGLINGYPVVNITGYGTKKTWKVHQLVAIHFIDNANKFKVINHINGIKTDNRVENLEWCTQSHNCKHAFEIGLKKVVKNFGSKNPISKKVISESGNVFESLNSAAKEYGLNPSTLGAMLRGQNSNKTDLKYVCGN